MLFCDGPRGVVCGTGKSTCFPVSMLRGATFDTELEEIDRPVKVLRGFKRVNLVEGENKIVVITCPISELCWYNEEQKHMELEHMEYQIYAGSSSHNKDLLSNVITI